MNEAIVSAFLDEIRWREVFEGNDITGIAILDRNSLHFCAKKHVGAEEASLLYDSDSPTRTAVLYTDRPAGANCGHMELDGMGYPSAGVSRPPFPRPSGK